MKPNQTKLNFVTLCAVATALFMSVGCAMKKVAPAAPPPAPESILDSSPEQSLFKGDQAVLSDQDIARILSTQIKLADRHHLAILNLSSSYAWSQDLAEVEARNFAELLRTLKSSQQLTVVRLLPTLLVPEKRTVPYLREAAARIQADLLFVYTSRIESFRRDRFFKSDEVRAQCWLNRCFSMCARASWYIRRAPRKIFPSRRPLLT